MIYFKNIWKCHVYALRIATIVFVMILHFFHNLQLNLESWNFSLALAIEMFNVSDELAVFDSPWIWEKNALSHPKKTLLSLLYKGHISNKLLDVSLRLHCHIVWETYYDFRVYFFLLLTVKHVKLSMIRKELFLKRMQKKKILSWRIKTLPKLDLISVQDKIQNLEPKIFQ